MLFDIGRLRWDDELADLLHVPARRAAGGGRLVRPHRHDRRSASGLPPGIPVSGIAGDQQAALFGQSCVVPGHGQEHVRHRQLRPAQRRLDVPAAGRRACSRPSPGRSPTGRRPTPWRGRSSSPAPPCNGCATASACSAAPTRSARSPQSVPDNGGVFVVPAFTGLGSPWWDPYARGTVLGITRGTTKAHLARAVVEAMAFQTRDVIEAMVHAGGTPITELRVDGGASAMDAMLQFQADLLGVAVSRPLDQETTALGAAFLAGLAEGVFADLDDVARRWTLDATFQPSGDRAALDAGYATWLRAVDRSRGFSSVAVG